MPPPADVFAAFLEVIPLHGYWMSWVASFSRVITGFLVAMIIGIPFGLLLAVNRYFRGVFFPPFEILRPIPPLAWVPASLIFWPTNEICMRHAEGIRSDNPVFAKLWYFWTNHFTISDTQFLAEFSTGAYHREFIRANLDKTFETMVYEATIAWPMIMHLSLIHI